MKKRFQCTIILLVSFSLSSHFAFAQSIPSAEGEGPSIEWEKLYGDGYELGWSVLQTSDGGYVTCGNSVMKVDSKGQLLWKNDFEGMTFSIIQTLDGGYVSAGYYSREGEGSSGMLIKMDEDGNLIWTKAYGGDGGEELSSVIQTSDGGYIIVGYTYSNSTSGDVYLIKTDGNGDTIWEKTFGGPDLDAGQCVKQSPDGGFIITGYTLNEGRAEDLYLIKTNNNGDLLWTKTFGGANRDVGYSVDIVNSDGYIITGESADDVILIKTDLDGNMLWTKTFGREGSDIGFSVRQTRDGGFIIVGQSSDQVYVVKTDLVGNILWRKTIEGSNNWDTGYDVKQTQDGGYIISADRGGPDIDGSSIYLIKLYPEYFDNVSPVFSSILDLELKNDSALCSSSVSLNIPNVEDESELASLINDAPASFALGTTIVTWTATDIHGNSSSATQRVTVINQSPIISSINPSNALTPINTPITVNISYVDNNVTTATINWDDGYVETIVNPATPFSVSHTYLSAGVHAIMVTIEDACGESAIMNYEYVVSYDPSGGFVTGGGWIQSPLNAFVTAPTLAGKANFGFVSKYQKGDKFPSGNTEFQFQIGQLNFKSTSYDWLVVACTKAQYKGTGTINGSGNYGFLITAIDGSPDKFRIKIWDKAASQVVYDNQLGAPEDSNNATSIGGGGIVVHDTKCKTISPSARTANSFTETEELVETNSLKIYPNPVQSILHLEISDNTDDQITIEVIDVLGRTVISNDSKSTSDNAYSIDATNLTKGIYLVKVKSSNLIQTLRMVKD